MATSSQSESERWKRVRNVLVFLYIIFAFLGALMWTWNAFGGPVLSELFVGIAAGCISGLVVLAAERFMGH